MKLLKRGSVKDIYEGSSEETLVFTFSDRYSVFDWGTMPDALEDKGRALAFFCSFFFEELSAAEGWMEWFGRRGGVKGPLERGLALEGLKTHFISPLDEGGCPTDIFSVGDSIEVRKCRVPEVPFRGGNYDYGFYEKQPVDTLVPLEVIFRHGLPSGSSLLKRIGDKAYLEELGLESPPLEGCLFETPVIEFSTKLERSDRYISMAEASRIAGMDDGEVAALKELALLLALRLKDIFDGIGIELWDGKFEFAFVETPSGRTFELVDSIGPDEVRLLASGIHLSKEMFRAFYRKLDWMEAIDQAHRIAKKRGTADWKKICVEQLCSQPPRLPDDLKKCGEDVYRSLCNALSQKFYDRDVFENTPRLDGLVGMLKGGGKRVVVIGSGGREHALAWKISRSSLVEQVIVVPGNEGMELTPKVSVLAEQELPRVFADRPDLVVVGPEGYLFEGLVDRLREQGIAVFGPSREAARLESSKVFMKDVLREIGIPTADYSVASSWDEARSVIESRPDQSPLVVKSDGPAGGKGVFVCRNRSEALEAAKNVLVEEDFPIKSRSIIIEEKLEGQELSSFYLCDGKRAVYLASARDYKRVGDFDKGPNTGGMGCYILADWPMSGVRRQLDTIAAKTISYMADRGTPYQGVLFIGSMIVGGCVYVLEFNVRFGDPETQAIVPALEGDLFEILDGIVRGEPTDRDIPVSSSVHVVASSKGYPSLGRDPVEMGCPISFENPEILEGRGESVLFMAGVKKQNGGFVNSGGRVLGVTTVDDAIAEARAKSYAAMEGIAFEGMHYRKDIALNVEDRR